MDRRMEQHKSSMAVAAEELKSCKLDMMQKIAEVGSKGEKIQGTFMKEIKVKDEIIKDLKNADGAVVSTARKTEGPESTEASAQRPKQSSGDLVVAEEKEEGRVRFQDF